MVVISKTTVVGLNPAQFDLSRLTEEQRAMVGSIGEKREGSWFRVSK